MCVCVSSHPLIHRSSDTHAAEHKPNKRERANFIIINVVINESTSIQAASISHRHGCCGEVRRTIPVFVCSLWLTASASWRRGAAACGSGPGPCHRRERRPVEAALVASPGRKHSHVVGGCRDRSLHRVDRFFGGGGRVGRGVVVAPNATEPPRIRRLWGSDGPVVCVLMVP